MRSPAPIVATLSLLALLSGCNLKIDWDFSGEAPAKGAGASPARTNPAENLALMPTSGSRSGKGLQQQRQDDAEAPAPEPSPMPSEGSDAPASCDDDDAPENCLALKVVSYRDRDGETVISEGAARSAIGQVNRIWAECRIGFALEHFEAIDPQRYELNFRTASAREFDRIRRSFADDRTLLVVATGSWDRSGSLGGSYANAWTRMPGMPVHGAVLEGPIAADANMIAHELGHYLNLGHVNDDGVALMSPQIHPSSVRLSASECREAQRAVDHFWTQQIRAPHAH
jgi:hypothetical protein